MTATHPQGPPAVDLDGAAVFRRCPSPQLEWVEVGGEVVAWTQANESLHLFDSISSLVFQLMDGQASLDQTVSDLLQGFAIDEATLRRDVLACVTSLESLGAVERVG